MATWQSYVDDWLVGQPLRHGGHLESGAIAGLDGGLWAKSAAFPDASTEQLQAIAEAFKEAAPEIRGTGLKLGDRKYMCVFYDEGKIFRGKLQNGGLAIKKAGTCMVLGIYAAKDQAGDTNEAVENLADYLEANGA